MGSVMGTARTRAVGIRWTIGEGYKGGGGHTPARPRSHWISYMRSSQWYMLRASELGSTSTVICPMVSGCLPPGLDPKAGVGIIGHALPTGILHWTLCRHPLWPVARPQHLTWTLGASSLSVPPALPPNWYRQLEQPSGAHAHTHRHRHTHTHTLGTARQERSKKSG